MAAERPLAIPAGAEKIITGQLVFVEAATGLCLASL